ncbi:hypothetical protein Q7689_00795 [Nocardiopsis tropica]|uniref:hypothetical protein n=1 Tax=Nocardiopsis tropica TaxID=109330 RepID=UPI002E8A94AD|nr:hypothetical protein [Nocardiopsis tropica]
MRFGREVLTVVRGPGTDRHGDPLPGIPTETPISGWDIQPGATTEDTDSGNTVTAEWIAIGPPAADITATDQVRWRGDLYQVEGAPGRWPDERGRPHHTEVELSRIRG